MQVNQSIEVVDLPAVGQNAFGEGDVVTIIQTSPTLQARGRIMVDDQGFSAIYLHSLNKHLRPPY